MFDAVKIESVNPIILPGGARPPLQRKSVINPSLTFALPESRRSTIAIIGRQQAAQPAVGAPALIAIDHFAERNRYAIHVPRTWRDGR